MSEGAAGARAPGRRWLPWVGALLGLGALAWVLRRFELNRFLAHVAEADARFLVLIAFAIMAEQLVRAWKWRQLLSPLRKGIGVFRLFGAIMAGYLLATVVPFGFGTVARSWLVARREDLMFAAVLATVALDRLTDGLVFAALVPLALALVAFPDPSGGIRAGLLWGGAGSFALLVAAAAAAVELQDGVSGGAEAGGGLLVPAAVRLDAMVVEDGPGGIARGPVPGVGGIAVGEGDGGFLVGEHVEMVAWLARGDEPASAR